VKILVHATRVRAVHEMLVTTENDADDNYRWRLDFGTWPQQQHKPLCDRRAVISSAVVVV
jgi:hypothetical protein